MIMNQLECLDELPPEALDAILRNDMASFIRAAFAELHAGAPLVWDQYLYLISARLSDVVSGKTRNLIITMPPRHLKSICVSVALPAFFLGHNPTGEVMAVSYGQELAKKFAEDTRRVMASGLYTRIFDTRLAGARQAPHALRTTAGGIRRATSIDGAATGVGADLLIFDDPQKPNEALSDAMRASTNQAYENTFLSRRNDPASCRTVIVMQRLHEDDFVGHVTGLGGEWEVLNLPAIAEADEAYPYETFMGRYIYRRQEGAALHPTRVPLGELDIIRAGMGEAAWASQYMQRPAPAGGGLVNTAWFKRYDDADLPKAFDRIVQSWDTANTIAEWSDYSVCTTWGVVDKRIFLIDVFRRRLIYPDLKRAIVQQATVHAATTILIEDKASGTQVIQDLRRDGLSIVEPCKPVTDKQIRMSGRAAIIEAGAVHVPREAHWLPEYLHELAVFPNGKYDDQVDSTSQALEAIHNPGLKAQAFLEIAREINARAANQATNYSPGPFMPERKQWARGCVEWQAEQDALAEAATAAASLPVAPDAEPSAPQPSGPARRPATFFMAGPRRR
jgi:predicted phage terminase large subunit-like protein